MAAKCILRYIKGTIDYELCFKKMDEDVNLIAFNDSDWASSLEDRRSTTVLFQPDQTRACDFLEVYAIGYIGTVYS